MAKLIFTLQEVVDIVKQNAELPEKIEDIQAEDNQVMLKINPGKLLPNIRIKVKFVGFYEGKSVLRIGTPIPSKIISLLIDIFAKRPEIEGVEIDYPNITIDINGHLKNSLKGIEVKSIEYSDNVFTLKV